LTISFRTTPGLEAKDPIALARTCEFVNLFRPSDWVDSRGEYTYKDYRSVDVRVDKTR